MCVLVCFNANLFYLYLRIRDSYMLFSSALKLHIARGVPLYYWIGLICN